MAPAPRRRHGRAPGAAPWDGAGATCHPVPVPVPAEARQAPWPHRPPPCSKSAGGQSPGPPEAEVKVVVVGDGGCGKTSLLLAFASGDFPKVYIPTVFEKYTASLQVGGKPVKIHLWDTAGQEDYDRLRPLSYSDAKVVLICFDVTSPNSFDNVLTKWYPEVNHFCKGVPVLLVGCKTDLRKLQEGRPEPISHQKGEAMARQVHAVSYLECSARYQENVRDIFVAACDAALRAAHPNSRRRRPRRGCVLC